MSGTEQHNPVIVIFGVSGSGKTTVAELVAEKLGLPCYDADDFHPQSNIDKMHKGIALTDADRKPWLEALADQIKIWKNRGGAVLACSALKERYRKILASKATHVDWVLLSGSFELIRSRMERRKDHFMNISLLRSQFDTLEVPDYGLKMEIDAPPGQIADAIITKLNTYE